MQAIVDFVRLCIALIECARSCGDEIADDTVTNNTDGLLAALGEHVILRQADEKYPHTYNTTW